MGTQIGSETVIGAVMAVPATALIATGQYWLGAAIATSAVVAGVLIARHRIRARVKEQQEYLSWAHAATSLGADPAPVIKAMRRADDEDEDGAPVVHLPRKTR